MGARGPLRNPNSRRGQAEARKQQRIAAVGASAVVSIRPADPPKETSGLPTCDAGVPRRVREIYDHLVAELVAAKVPIQQIDSHAIVMAARCLHGVESAEAIMSEGASTPELMIAAIRLVSQNGKDLQRWLEMICATPAARARIGVKSEPEKKAGPLAQLLARKQAHGS